VVFLAGNPSLFSRQRERELDLREREGETHREREREGGRDRDSAVGYCDRDEEEWRAWVVTSWMRKRCGWRPFSWTSSRGLFFFPREIVCFWFVLLIMEWVGWMGCISFRFGNLSEPYYEAEIEAMKASESTTMFIDFSHVMLFNNLLQKAISEEYLRFLFFFKQIKNI
jgi:hypothetical protein